MILERVYELALPRVSGKKIKEVRIGLELMAVELDDSSIGVTYVLRKEIGHACSALPQAGSLVGKPAEEIAGWALKGKNVIASSMGLAVLNSVAEFDKLELLNNTSGVDAVFSIEVQPTDTVGIIGHIGPVISRLKGKMEKLYIFERGMDIPEQVYPESSQPELLPDCQVVFISSSSLLNGTLEPLLAYCTKARDVVMVGSSTPLYPEAFIGTGVSMLSGTRWLPANRESILTAICQSAGMRQLIKYGEKMSVRVKR
ncbi:DUF364 domain-containing protein [Pelotomaculum terephthalicicum JT]|uniref:DUF364 domain-containing protein n=1 Tax=Pelotomaculum TaxID=191373 RepID=UPI0009D1F070|nr:MULTISPECIES: DUF364 domain-containing protein [Pelotomaculum]MCG9968669.1 DUF364 domain-containing protein [Pelotomaculum terephthalicicum JT]OPX85690.1 MAG: hypothetical protein A4E54_02289 [Pelotomaculum sp. PtaB.Bin117]OPY62020.1 MAG: hypothetical protein A4E56_01645 [Pelotomaculum sp. PtaU1.Bin065]